jgi:hypothetical protein
MRKIYWVSGGLVVLVAVLLLGLLASRVGGIAIRQAGEPEDIVLTLSEPALRGVPLKVTWTVPPAAEEPPVSVVLWLHDSAGDVHIGTGSFGLGSATVVLPCTEGAAAPGLVLRDTQTSQVLASRQIAVLPPGRECIN